MSENLQGEDYEVIIRTKTSDGTEVVTSTDAITDKWLANAVAGYDATNQKYSAYLKDGTSSSDKLTPEYTSTDLFTKDVKLISKDGKIYYLPEN